MGTLVSRDAHKSVVAGLVFGGVQPQWIWPRYDEQLHLAHPPSPDQVNQAWQDHPDAAGARSGPASRRCPGCACYGRSSSARRPHTTSIRCM